jgi:hypothetical protein
MVILPCDNCWSLPLLGLGNTIKLAAYLRDAILAHWQSTAKTKLSSTGKETLLKPAFA